ncbi:MAG TPA: triple tyrosine motif-containing protein, partial [Ferruginibacter sp.]|nr:triple tyrosine motif-containing protein [Ferruginibacter sp.]
QQGLYMQDIRPAIINSFTINDKDSANPLIITSLLIYRDQIIAGTDKKTILVIDKKRKQVVRRIRLPINPQLSNEITYFQPVHPDTIWISSASGLDWMNTRNFSTGTVDLTQLDPETPSIEFLYADSKNNIWIPPTVINTIFRYDYSRRTAERIDGNNDKLFKTNTTNSVAEDSAGNVWFGGDAIARWNPHLKKIDTLIEFLSTQKNRKKGFLVMSDSRGDIWVMLNDEGFARITNVPVHVRPENILPDNRGFYPTSFYDKIFVTTTNGLAYLDLKSLKAIIFHREDGLPSKAISSIRFAPDSSDRSIWFACGNIICTIPTSASSFYRQPPALAISEVAVINDTVVNYPTATIHLKHDQNDLRLSFSAVNYIDPENMRFAYRIINEHDSSWIEAGNQPNILLTNISPGKYALEAKVYAFDNKWPEQIKEMDIIIEPPF